MSFLHHYYTSSKNGIHGGSGFQTYSLSAGINHQEQEEIERLGMYTAPFGLPQMANEDIIENVYPKSFYFSRLKSGRYVMGISRYVGKDYSGRYGNYFSHSVVFEKKEFQDFPIEFFKSQAFREKLTKEEEESMVRPEPLPTTRLILKGSEINNESVLQFLQQGDRSERLKQLVSALIGYQKDKRRIVIIDQDENIPYWIGAVQYVFPKAFALEISFTTYTNDPMRNNAQICGIYHEETPPPFWNQQFYVFDVIRDYYSHVDLSRYAETVVDLFLYDRKELGQFLSFIELTGWNMIDIHMNELLQLYKLVIHGPQSIDLNELREAISVSRVLEDQKGIVSITDLLLNNWGKIHGQLEGFVLDVPSDLMEGIAQWWFKVAWLTNKKEHMGLAASFFYKSWTQLLIEKGQDHRETRAYYENIMEMNKDNRSFSIFALAPNRLTEVYGYCKTENTHLLPLFLTDFVHHAQRLNLDWDNLEKQRSYILQIINLAVEKEIDLSDICQKLSLLEQSFIQTVALLVKHYRDTGQRENEVYLLTACLQGTEEGRVNGKYLTQLIKHSETIEKSVFRILQNRIRESNKPITILTQLQQRLLSNSYELKVTLIGLINESIEQLLLRPLDDTYLNESQLLLSSDGLMDLLSNSDRIRLIESMEQRLPFSEEISRYSSILKLLETHRETLNLKSTINISMLLRVLTELEKQKDLKTDFIAYLKIQVTALTKDQYEKLLLWKFPLMTQYVHNKHGLLMMLFDALRCTENEELFFKTLIQQSRRTVKYDKATVIAAFCCCLVNRKKELSDEQIHYFEENVSLFKKVRDEVSKLPNAEQTDAYLAKVQMKLPEQKEASLFGKMKNLLKIGKNEG